MPPPSRAKTEISEHPNASPTSAARLSDSAVALWALMALTMAK